MASFVKRGDNWYASVRRKGYPSISKTLSTKILAQEWARGIEQSMDASKFSDARILSDIPLKVLIRRYIEEIGAVKNWAEQNPIHCGNGKLPIATHQFLPEQVMN